MNAIQMLKSDHRHVESLFEQYLTQSRTDALRDIVQQLSIHAAIEEQYLYPKIREVVPNGSRLADEGIEEHQAVKESLSEIDSARDGDPGVRAKLMKLKQNVEHHVSEEESEMFPKLEAHCSAQDLIDLGSKLESAKRLAPTHPHPHAPAQPPGNMVAGPAAAAIDRVRDAVGSKRMNVTATNLGLPEAVERMLDGMNQEGVARWLGWLSLALGAVAVARPGAVAAKLGLPVSAGVVAACGLREIASGVGIFAGRRPTEWMWARVAGDAIDLAILGTAFARRSARRGPLGPVTAAVAGITLVDLACARQLSRGGRADGHTLPRDRSIRIEHQISVGSPREECYRFWRAFENLPRFMTHLERVDVVDSRRSHWVANGPAGTRVEWDAELVNDVPNERIAWRSLEGSDVDSVGTVVFDESAASGVTVVRVKMNYRPPAGVVGDTVAKLLGEDPETQIADDLRRFKWIVEASSGASAAHRVS
jgi:uncharacterized membrane protein/hemerythrin superfamily protein